MLMKTRDEQNVIQTALDESEEDLAEVTDLISGNARPIYDVLIKHYGLCLKRHAMRQKDAESLVMSALKNFTPSAVEIDSIRSCVVDALTKAATQT